MKATTNFGHFCDQYNRGEDNEIFIPLPKGMGLSELEYEFNLFNLHGKYTQMDVEDVTLLGKIAKKYE